MKSIARWSSRNILAARIIIAISHILIGCIACYVGIALQLYDKAIPIQFFGISIMLFGITFFISSKVGYARISFYKRKVLDSIVMLCSFVMITTLANQKTTTHFTLYNSVQGSFSKEEVKPVAKPTVKELKKQIKELKVILKGDKPSVGAVIGAILLGLVLGGLVLSAACSLSCGGQNGLAVLVGVGGFIAIFFLIKLLLKPRKRPSEKESTEPSKPANQLG